MRRPQFIARQAAKPSGLLGRIVAAVMVRESEADNRAAIEALSVGSGDHVLDIGCGSGRSLELLLPLVGQGSVTGIDPSPLMADLARRRIRGGHARDQLMVKVASAEALPFMDEAFDAIMSVHTLYFWRNLADAAREMARVLRPGGRICLLFRTSSSPQSASFPTSVYRFRRREEVADSLVAAGFTVLSEMSADYPDEPLLLVAEKPDRISVPNR